MEYSLIANTGIHMLTFPLTLDFQEKFKLWFHEWYDTNDGEWKLELAEQVNFNAGTVYYSKKTLREKGYIKSFPEKTNIASEYEYGDLIDDGIYPIADDNGMQNGNKGEIFKMTFNDKHNTLEKYENVWLPAPYFFKRTEKKFKFGPLNWARFKLIPEISADGNKRYNVVVVFDTRTKYQADEYNEYPVFPDQFKNEMKFELCTNESFLMDYCSPSSKWGYIDNYLMKLVHPAIQRISQIKGQNVRRLSYIASYIYLIDYIAQHELFPRITLYKDTDVATRNVDMIVDIGNSRTTVLLREENPDSSIISANNQPFTQVPKLQLTDYTNSLVKDEQGHCSIRRHKEPFDMRLAFRKVDFGKFGISDSLQFVYPSFVRLGQEANELVHMATMSQDSLETLSTYSSPKRYLWDSKPNKEEWRFLVISGEPEDTILNIKGLSQYLTSNGSIDKEGNGGTTYHYSRKTLMTFSFLEMLNQAQIQINGLEHRTDRGNRELPRRIKRIVVTCPTAMSRVERTALISSAEDAVELLSKFDNSGFNHKVEIVPNWIQDWYYDEATCAQLVYMYGEVGYKYKGCCSEFFNLYGKIEDGDKQHSLTLASLDIGAGTSDVMISKYTYTKDDITRITPDPLFYDSFYFAGDDMLEALIKNIMYMSEDSAFYHQMKDKSFEQFQQSMKDFVGPDYHGQTMEDRIIRRDFNIQYSIPLMYYFLDLVKNKHKDCVVRYSDVFADCPPSEIILNSFENRFGFSLKNVDWDFNYDNVCGIISKEFEPLLKKIATIMFAYSCDVVILSGRPASLQPIRDLFLKYYCVSPNRLILLNNYFVGDWYPYDKNTGYIVDSKPIVAVGAAIAHYAAELSNLNNFIIETNKLQANLKSTINYIEASREGQPVSYFITPKKHSGDLTVSSLPATLNVRQIEMDSYPARTLYTIDFDRTKMASKINKEAYENEKNYSIAHVHSLVNDLVDEYKKRLPFKLTIEREPDDLETLKITGITDKNDIDISDGVVELHIQSLGADEKYWLDSGAFAF